MPNPETDDQPPASEEQLDALRNLGIEDRDLVELSEAGAEAWIADLRAMRDNA